MRKEIFERMFAKIAFKTDDPIALNRLRLITKYYTELQLKRMFADEITAEENMLLKTTLSEFSKLFIDKKGELLDGKSKASVPWDEDEEVKKIKESFKKMAELETENERLRKLMEKKGVFDDNVF